MTTSKAFNPDNIYNPNKSTGTTQTSSGIITDVVLTEKLQFKDGSTITGVSQDFRENQYDNCPSSFALFQGLSTLDSNIKMIDPDNNFFRDNTVISLPLIDTGFGAPWESEGNWTVADAQAIYCGDSQPNVLKIPVEVIPFMGYYYLHLTIDRLDSGLIKIYDHADTLVTTIKTYGEYSIEMYIANADITSFRIVVENIFPGDYVNLSYAGFHRVTDRFRDYFMYILRTQGGGGGGDIDLDLIKSMIDTAINNITTYFTEMINRVKDSLLEHVNDRGNVHGLTLADIKAASVNHTHPEFDLLAGDLTSIFTHVNDRETNPHGITYSMIHASPDDHHHELSEIGVQGAADMYHDHDGVYLNSEDRQEIVEMIPEVAQRLIDQALSKLEDGIAKFEPFIVVPKETGIDVLGAEDSIITEPAVVVLTNYILHRSSSDYDYDSGLAGCNRKLIDDESAAKAFSDYFGLAASFQEETTTIKETILTYRFHTNRKLTSCKIIKDLQNKVKGFVKKFEVYLDGILISSVNNDTWVTLDPATIDNDYQVNLNDISCKEIKFIIQEVVMDPVDLNWAFRAIIDFGEVNDHPKLQYKLNPPFALGFGQNGKLTVDTALMADFDPPVAGESWYLFLKKNVDLDGKEYLTVQLDSTPSEFSQNYLGVDMLLDKYKGTATHPTWGSINCSTQNPKFPVNNLYSNENVHYQSQDNDLDVSIQHIFPSKVSGLRGYRIVFDQKIIAQNLVPDQIKVIVGVAKTIDNLETIEEITTTALTNYYPAIRKDSDFVWEIVKFPDDDTQPRDVKFVKIEMKGTRQQSALAMSKFVMMFRSWQYNPYTGESSNDLRCPLGRLDSIKLPATSNLKVGVIHRGCPQGSCIYYPVDHFNILTTGTYQIPNLFGTNMISAEIMATEVAGAFMPSAQITNITDQDIFVEVINPGRYAVKVNRLW